MQHAYYECLCVSNVSSEYNVLQFSKAIIIYMCLYIGIHCQTLSVTPNVVIHGSPFSLECQLSPDPTGYIRWNVVTASNGNFILYQLNSADNDKDVFADVDARYGRNITITNDKSNGKFTLTFETAERARDDQRYTCEGEFSLKASDAVQVHVFCKLSCLGFILI